MNKAGLYAQFGFEYQKMVFIICALSMRRYDQVSYEGKDDVDLSSTYVPLASITPNNNGDTFVQVKSGTVTKEILKRVFYNWLLIVDRSKKFVCVTEMPTTVADDNFVCEVVKDIEQSRTTKKRKDALVKLVNEKYSHKEVDLKKDLQWLVDNAKFYNATYEDLFAYGLQEYKSNYAGDIHEEIAIAQFEELLKMVRSYLADALLNRKPYDLPYRNLIDFIVEIRTNINDTYLNIDFTEYRSTSDSKIKKILDANGESLQQLRLVTNSQERIMEYLTEQIFYEDFKDHFCRINKLFEINSLENYAYENYQDTIFELEDSGELSNPKSVFINTIKKPIVSTILNQDFGSTKFYSRGCYIHLTDTGVEEKIKIRWGVINEEDQ